MPKLDTIKKVLVIGSGPIVIGQAAEFDYAGTQACLALKEEGIEVVLVNNNPATIMTDENIADHIYMEPLTVESLTEIIKIEQPDGLLPTLGGQTGLNLAAKLTEHGVLKDYNVTLLGTPLETIERGEDREQFKAMMEDLHEPVAMSQTVENIEDACQFADKIGYPVIVRPAYTLGGAGGGIADSKAELMTIVKNGLNQSPIHQVLIEQSVKGWKEIEYEVMRDDNDTAIIICNMENIDAVGVHTGDSIVVAPSQTLTDHQHQMLRDSSLKVIRALGVIGGCNIQFALNPLTDDYIIIEVNPRVSRSSALASKATGYPIARIAAKLSLGYYLDEVLNPITGDTYASFEPAIDYVALKLPRFAFDKFYQANRHLGTQMKATGEVMSLGRNFTAALTKAIRSMEINQIDFHRPALSACTEADLIEALENPTDERLFYVMEALKRGMSVDDLHHHTLITRYFLHEFKTLIDFEAEISQYTLETVPKPLLTQAKKYSLSEVTLARLLNTTVRDINDYLRAHNITASYKMVDTCAGEFEAKTPYFYSSWLEYDEVTPLNKQQKIVVLGSGPIRIGQGVEFDYCSVHAAFSLKDQAIEAIVVNNNPETVSTDYSTADHLYFEPLTAEDVEQIVLKEQADGVLIQFGGQTAVNLAEDLNERGIKLIGTDINNIDVTEDREQFYQLLDDLAIPHIPGTTVLSYEKAKETAETFGYPVLLRPSYVIGGQGMVVLDSEQALDHYLNQLLQTETSSKVFPLLLDRYIEGKEVEIDVICDGEDIVIPGIFEHVEKAGVHSGDSMAIFPAPNLTNQQETLIETYTKKLSKALDLKGLINIQFVFSEDEETLYCLEVNPRASRTVPIASKVTGIDMVDLAVRTQLNQSLKELHPTLGLQEKPNFYAVKMPIFSHTKLSDVDPLLQPEMRSTGEAIGLGETVEAALQKAFGYKENQFMAMNETDGIYLGLQDVDEALIKQLAKVNGLCFANEIVSDKLIQYGLTRVVSVTEEKAIELLDKGTIKLVADQQTATIRLKALREGVMVLSRKETLRAYLDARVAAPTLPKTINRYRKMMLEEAKR
ncbi:carbamoyl-phosphate synthase large chain [Halolactibacillus miurensis]|uniref:Carbamoyl phosphate synthase large chain n=1 Tax=Halolactibacillus miurensis TaxID=306541 RepID=A0A1I6V0M1_9BACI|nr:MULTISPECIES: carbamoyl-phosphate synthase (glutamine-hydrolyzing) large subunit [Halolactibacillus]GEM05742.1 carbamoyl-phosphate synthase large chain [Halolactibacillus miurensis]SFT07255.1 carbamoyl-phosphate synthase large subunit [Halolactibacillus miurensis]